MRINKQNLHEDGIVKFSLVLLCGVVVACGGSTKIDFGVSLEASNRCNLSEMGQPVPVTVRVYTLQDRTRFEQATFQELWKKDYEYLGKDLLHRKEVTLRPSSKAPIVLNVDPEANEKFIGILALFREYKDGVWRRVIPIERPGFLSFGMPEFVLKCDQNVMGEAVKD
ncbi:MAG: type VI secretion system lipoprotein TssJ [Nitrospirales bacterium]